MGFSSKLCAINKAMSKTLNIKALDQFSSLTLPDVSQTVNYVKMVIIFTSESSKEEKMVELIRGRIG